MMTTQLEEGRTVVRDRPSLENLLHAKSIEALECLAADLVTTPYSLLLMTPDGTVVARWATGEHAQWLDALHIVVGDRWSLPGALAGGTGAPMVIATAPVHRPGAGRLVGLIALIAPLDDGSDLIGPIVRQTARKLDYLEAHTGSPANDRAHEVFRQARRRTRAPLALVTPAGCTANAAATALLGRAATGLSWDQVVGAASTDASASQVVVDSAEGRPCVATIEWIVDGSRLVAAMLTFHASAAPSASARRDTRYGWESLTDSELGLTALVAAGLSNREIAQRLYVSPHTVDSHLRHIFRKLEITSRVELASRFAVHSSREQMAS